MIKQLAVVSGKGGTGKTTITAVLASLINSIVVVDCDVDASNLYLLLHPQILERNNFYSGKKAEIKSDLCNECGKCVEVCKFESIDKNKINEITCTGCGVCLLVCPLKAIQVTENLAGEWYISKTKVGSFIHARLGIAEDNSGKLVAQIRSVAKKRAEEENKEIILMDGPPGIGCPVISTITGCDFVLIVTEPTLSGFHDLKRIENLVSSFKIKCGVLINKADINLEINRELKNYCQKKEIPILGEIPFSDEIINSLVNSNVHKESEFFELFSSDLKEKFIKLNEDLGTYINR